MSRKRPRRGTAGAVDTSRKKRKTTTGEFSELALVEHPTLSVFYPQVVTLRSYLLSSVPASSRSRRRKIASAGLQELPVPGTDDGDLDKGKIFAAVLDKTLICTIRDAPRIPTESREKDFRAFSQQTSSSVRSTLDEGTSSLSEVGSACLVIELNTEIRLDC